MKKVFLTFLFLIFCFPSFANAEKKLTLFDVIDLSLTNNPQTKQAWLNVKIAEHDYKKQKAGYYPEVTATTTYGATEKDYKKDTTDKSYSEYQNSSVSVSYLLYDFGEREALVKQYKYQLNAVGYDKNYTLQNLVYTVVDAYYGLFSSIANYKATKESEALSLQSFKAAKLKYKIGLAPLKDKLQAETAYSQSQLDKLKADNDVKLKRAKLNYLLNLGPSYKLNLAEPNLKITKQFDKKIEGLMEEALQKRPELLSKKQSQKAYLEKIKNAKRERYPSLSFTASQGYVDDLTKTNSNYDSSSVGLQLSMPLFGGFSTSNEIAKSKRQLDFVKSEINDLEQNIKYDVWESYQNFKTSGETYNTSKKLLKSAKETEKVTLGMYKNGKASMIDLLDAQSKLADAKTEFIESQHNWFVTRADLIRAIGSTDLNNK